METREIQRPVARLPGYVNMELYHRRCARVMFLPQGVAPTTAANVLRTRLDHPKEWLVPTIDTASADQHTTGAGSGEDCVVAFSEAFQLQIKRRIRHVLSKLLEQPRRKKNEKKIVVQYGTEQR